MSFATIFLLIWSTGSLVSVKKEFFFLLNYNLIFIAILRVKLGFSGFDTTSFHIFFSFRHLPIFWLSRFFILLAVHITHYWRSKNCTIEHIKIFKRTDYCFNGFDSTSSKNLIEFFLLSLAVVFTLSFSHIKVLGE